jgi:hypothetical protein
MAQTAELLAHSVGQNNKPIATFRVRYPKFIHGETLTHRLLESNPPLVEAVPDGLMYDHDLSRNASSSRATPVKKMIEAVQQDPVIPISWGKNQPGMQAREILGAEDAERALQMWLEARDDAVRHAQRMADLGAHKQIVNRILEPWMHIIVVITATEWNNFFALRRHEDAQPEIKDLADKMWDLLEASEPKTLEFGHWHLPFIQAHDHRPILDYAVAKGDTWVSVAKRVSAARCARTSYYDFEGKVSPIEKDIELYDKLVVRDTIHASPLEHQATPDSVSWAQNGRLIWNHPNLHGNLKQWVQFRKMIVGEAVPG